MKQTLRFGGKGKPHYCSHVLLLDKIYQQNEVDEQTSRKMLIG
jgi:hypothetical protein